MSVFLFFEEFSKFTDEKVVKRSYMIKKIKKLFKINSKGSEK